MTDAKTDALQGLASDMRNTAKGWAGDVSLQWVRDCVFSWAKRASSIAAQPAVAVGEATFAEWLATEMPAGTVIGDPQWWANRIARQYRVRSATPPAASVDDATIQRALDTKLGLDHSLRQLIRGDTMAVGYSKVAVVRALLRAIDSAGGAKGACGTCGGRGWIDNGHEQDDGRRVSAPEGCPDCTQQPTKE